MNNKAKFETPIILIAWKRPEKTYKVINSIKKIEPKNLYVACDGPLKNDLYINQQIEATRKLILENITWDCELKTLFSDHNQGCKIGVSNAINWFFDNVDSGIILEDDCLPHQDFFYFCSELLDKYRYDDRVWSIAGNNVHKDKSICNESYFFSKYSHCWGWATWKRCWSKYDRDLKDWPCQKSKGILNNIFITSREKKYWRKTLDNIFYYSKPNTWDYQWSYTCFVNSGLTIIPKENLIYNIGFDKEATHTRFGNPNKAINKYERFTTKVFPMKHPHLIHEMINVDKYTDAICYSGGDFFSRVWFQTISKKIFIKLQVSIKKIKDKLF